MGPIGMPEMVMIFIILALLAIPGILIVGLVIFLEKRRRNPPVPPPLDPKEP